MIELRLKPAISYAESQGRLLVVARTDAVRPWESRKFGRARQYAEVGTKMIFIAAPEDERQLAQAANEFKDSPFLSVANMIKGSPKTPCGSPRELHEWVLPSPFLSVPFLPVGPPSGDTLRL